MKKPYPEVGQRWRNVKSGRVAVVTHVGPDPKVCLSAHRLILVGHNYGARRLSLSTLHEGYQIVEEAS